MSLLLTAFMLLAAVTMAHASSFGWDLGTEPDLAGYRLYQQEGPCLNNIATWYKVKTFGVVDHGFYAPPIAGGIYCFKLKAFNTSGLISKPSNKVQLN